MGATAFDHRFYPHLIDWILSYLDYGGCYVARNVCRSWRERVTSVPLLQAHDHMELVCTRSGRLLVRARCIDLPPPSITVHVHPTLPEPWVAAGTEGGWWAPPNPQLRVVDVLGAKRLAKEGNWIPGFATRARLLRWYGAPPCPMESLNLQHTLFFVDLREGRKVPRIWVDTMQHPREVTVTVRCEADPTACDQGGHFDINSRLTTRITVILQDHRRSPSRKPSEEPTEQPPRSPTVDSTEGPLDKVDAEVGQAGSSIVYLYAFLNRSGSAQLVTTIVGLEAFLPTSELQKEFVDRIEQRVRKSRSITAQQFRQRCRFLSHEAYRAEVGDGAYNLHTIR